MSTRPLFVIGVTIGLVIWFVPQGRAADFNGSGADIFNSPNFSFPTRVPTLNGTVLEFDLGSTGNEVLFRFPLFPAGTFSQTDPLSVSVTIEYVYRASVDPARPEDHDTMIGVSDGSSMIMFEVADNNNGAGGSALLTDLGTTGALVSASTLFMNAVYPPIGDAISVQADFTLETTQTSMTGSFGIGAGADILAALDKTQALSLVFRGNNLQEQYGIASLTVNTTPECITPPFGLVSWWPFDGNTDDIGTAVPPNDGINPSQTYQPGKVLDALIGDGPGTPVLVNDADSLDVTTLTIEGWIRLDSVAFADTLLVFKGNDAGENRTSPYSLGVVGSHPPPFSVTPGATVSGSPTPGKLFFQLADDTPEHMIISSDAIPTAVFTHIAVTADGLQAKIYINGQLDTAVGQLKTPFNSGFPLRLVGLSDARPTLAFLGLVDELTLYNRALTAQEILGIFLTGSAGKCKPERLVLDLDIKPGSCPNSFNRNSHGVLPVAIVGSDDFDVTLVDTSTVQLSRADGVGGSATPNEGPPGPHSTIDDVATPLAASMECECDALAGDGIPDLSMKFRSDDVVAALELNALPAGDLVRLVVTGTLLDGTPFETATDCIRLVPPGTPPGMLTVESNMSTAWLDMSPLDIVLDGGGFAAFDRVFPQGTVVTLTAEATMNGRPLIAWQLNGVSIGTTSTTRQIVITGDTTTVRAIYQSMTSNNMPILQRRGVNSGPSEPQ